MVARNLNPRQKEAVSHTKGPLLIAAGAGSGKTRTLTSRLLFLLENGVPGEKIVAITFTNKAAKEMADRVRGMFPGGLRAAGGRSIFYNQPPGTPFIGTFHSFGVRILKRDGEAFGRTPNFSIFDNDDSIRVLRQLVKRLNTEKKYGAPLFYHHISRAKNELVKPDELSGIEPRLLPLLKAIYEEYEAALKDQNAFDFDDLIEKPVRILQDDSELRAVYEAALTHFLVDEFQDTNAAQYELVRLLAGALKNVSVVGDDQQSIYSFRGSDFRNFLNFDRDWPESKVVLLEENYRSSGNIVSAASAMISHNALQKPKKLWTDNPPGSPVFVREHEDEDAEASWVAETIQKLRRSDSKREIALLYRTNAQSRPIEQALIERDIPYRISGGIRFYDRKEIRDIVACLRWSANQKDAVSRARIEENFLKKPSRELVATLPAQAAMQDPVALIGFIIKTTDYFEYLKRNYPNAEERIENISELIAFAAQQSDLAELLEKITLLQSGDSTKGSALEAPVELMTIHIAKGLEFDTVFVLGVNEGLLPHQMSYRDGQGGVEEERRLMYVAMTRAKRELYLNFYDIGSRFLYEIPGGYIDFKSDVSGARELTDDEERYILLD